MHLRWYTRINEKHYVGGSHEGKYETVLQYKNVGRMGGPKEQWHDVPVVALEEITEKDLPMDCLCTLREQCERCNVDYAKSAAAKKLATMEDAAIREDAAFVRVESVPSSPSEGATSSTSSLTKAIEAAREALEKILGPYSDDPNGYQIATGLGHNALAALPNKPMTELELITLLQDAEDTEWNGRSREEVYIDALRDANVLYVEEK